MNNLESKFDKRMSRVEALLNAEPIPKEWNITPKRIKEVSLKTGFSLDTARKALIIKYGEKLECEKRRIK